MPGCCWCNTYVVTKRNLRACLLKIILPTSRKLCMMFSIWTTAMKKNLTTMKPRSCFLLLFLVFTSGIIFRMTVILTLTPWKISIFFQDHYDADQRKNSSWHDEQGQASHHSKPNFTPCDNPCNNVPIHKPLSCHSNN